MLMAAWHKKDTDKSTELVPDISLLYSLELHSSPYSNKTNLSPLVEIAGKQNIPVSPDLPDTALCNKAAAVVT